MKKYIPYHRSHSEVHMVIAFQNQAFCDGLEDCRVLKLFYYRPEADKMKEILQEEADRTQSGTTYACITKKVYY